VDGALINEEKFVRVFFENTGISPVAPVGRFQLSDPNFVDRVFEPVDFKMPEIRGGEVAFTDIPVASDLEDGFFRVFVTAQSGEVRITRLFEANLVFDDPNKLSIPDLALRIGGFVLAALGLVFGVRLIRGGKTKEKSARKPRSKSRRLPSNQPVPTPPEESLEALQAAIARMEQQFQELNKELAAATKPPVKRKAPAKAKTVAAPKPVSSTAQTAKKAAAKPAPKRTATASAKRTPARATAKAPAKPTVKKVAATKSPATPVKAKPAVAKPRARATSSKPATKKTEG